MFWNKSQVLILILIYWFNRYLTKTMWIILFWNVIYKLIIQEMTEVFFWNIYKKKLLDFFIAHFVEKAMDRRTTSWTMLKASTSRTPSYTSARSAPRPWRLRMLFICTQTLSTRRRISRQWGQYQGCGDEKEVLLFDLYIYN